MFQFNGIDQTLYYALTDDNIDDLPQVMKENNAHSLFIGSRYITSEKDELGLRIQKSAYTKDYLPNMEKYSFIRRLKFMSPFITDISPIHDLSSLRSLSLNGNERTTLNYKSFPHLKAFSSGVRGGIEKIWHMPSLEQLELAGLKHQHYTSGEALENLKYLTLHQTAIDDLSMLKECRSLEHLVLTNMRKLTDISFLKDIKTLKYLRIESVNQVTDFSPLLDLPNLQMLLILNSKKEPLENQDMFLNLKKLQYFTGSIYQFPQREKIKEYARQNAEKYKDELVFLPPLVS